MESHSPSREEFLSNAVLSLQRHDLMSELPTSDTFHALLLRYLPGYKRSRNETILPPDSTIPVSDSILQAAQTDHWRRVANIVRECITRPIHHTNAPNTGDIDQLLMWWHIRFIALWKLRFMMQLREELDALWQVLESVRIIDGDLLVPLVQTSHVPFCLHVLRAQEIFQHGERQHGVRLLWKHMQHAKQGQSLVWRARYIRIALMLASFLLEADEILAATSVIASLTESLDTEGDWHPTLALMLARLALRMGDMHCASAMLDRAKQVANTADPLTCDAIATHEVIAQFIHYPHAEHHVSNTMREYKAKQVDQALTNTMAFDSFLRGEVLESTQILERFMHDHPTTFATSHALGANLLTLLSVGLKDVQEEKQRVVRFLVQWAGDDPSCVERMIV